MEFFTTWTPITPSDTVDLPRVTQGLWIGGAGNVAAVMQNNQVGLITGVPAGAWLPLAVRRVNATGTTATTITAFYGS